MSEATQSEPIVISETREEADLALEVVILVVFGIFMLLFGAILPLIHTGSLPYSPDGTYGLFLVLTSFQVITMGKTPFGDLRRSWLVVLAGIAAALLGMTSCFIPGRLTEPVRLAVGTVLTAGGISLFLQLALSREKARLWLRWPGAPRHLAVACSLVYLLSVILGLITLRPGTVTDSVTAGLLLVDGASLFYLAWAIQAVNRLKSAEDPERRPAGGGGPRPADESRLPGEASLSLSLATLILVAVLLTFLGLVLFPVNLGWLPFSPDGLQGLLLTVFAIQAMSLGDTPVGRFRRSWVMLVFGATFVALGAFSCIVPGVLTDLLRILLALLNLAAGAVYFVRRLRDRHHEKHHPLPGSVPPILNRLRTTQTVLNVVVITFGVAMLAPGIVPGIVNAAIIVVNGLLLFLLASFLRKLESMEWCQAP